MASSAEQSAPAVRSGRTLWLWVAGAFLFLGALWTAMFMAARSITIESVPGAPGVHKKG